MASQNLYSQIQSSVWEGFTFQYQGNLQVDLSGIADSDQAWILVPGLVHQGIRWLEDNQCRNCQNHQNNNSVRSLEENLTAT